MRRALSISLAAVFLVALTMPSSTLAAAPTITGYAPKGGPIGTLVTITGTALSSANAVKFNGVTASVTSNSATQIKAKVPAGASTGKISVTTAEGTATTTAKFTVTIGIQLSKSMTEPKSTILVAGSGFSSGTAAELYFDGTSASLVGTNSNGTFVGAALTIPGAAVPGQHWVSVVDRATSRIAQKPISVFTNWPQLGGGAKHHGRNTLENVITPGNVGDLEEAWTSTATGGPFGSSPAVVNGVVYAGSNDNKLYAYNAFGCGASHCPPLWTGTTGHYITSSPAVANGVVFVSSTDDKLYAFPAGCGASTCSPLWSANTGAQIWSSPTIVNGTVYVGSNEGSLWAFDAGGCGGAPTCYPEWTSVPTGGQVRSSAAVDKGRVYIGSNDHNLYAYDATGCLTPPCDPIWQGPTGGAITASPAVANGVVYAGSADGKLYAFRAEGCGQTTCDPMWTAATGDVISSSPAIGNGAVFVASEDGTVYAFPVNPFCSVCDPLWTSTATGVHRNASPVIANGVVYVASDNHGLSAFAAAGCGAATCAPLWAARTDRVQSSPTVVNGVLYFTSLDQMLHAWDLGGGTGVTSLPAPTLTDLRPH